MENAILMASGMGTRMRPVTETIPKPLVEVAGKPMIETLIDGLQKRQVDKIIIVVGYLGEKFSYLRDKYSNIEIIRNNYFETVNNISSVYVARKYLLDGDCFICEADLFVAEDSVFIVDLNESCYFGKKVQGHSEDWVFDQDNNGIITRVGKVGDDKYNMTGISFFKNKDAKTLHKVVEEEYGLPGYETLFWDDVVNKHIKDFQLHVHPIQNNQIIEIDTLLELEEIRRRFLPL